LSFSLVDPTLCMINNHCFMFSFSWAKTISRQPPTTSPTQLYRENGASECWSRRRSSRQQGSQQSKLEQENPMHPCLARRMRAFSPLDRPKWSLTTRDRIHQIILHADLDEINYFATLGHRSRIMGFTDHPRAVSWSAKRRGPRAAITARATMVFLRASQWATMVLYDLNARRLCSNFCMAV
jgi:hypothetical protein